MSDDLDDLRERLRTIADELADLALDRLRRAVGQDDPEVAASEERRLTRARRAVEKAISVLDDGAGD